MKEQNKKLKTWFSDHKEEMVRCAYYAVGCCIGCFVTSKMMSNDSAKTLQKWHTDGFIKFFDPREDVEVDVYEAVNIVRQLYH